jgi:hypothetical protein
LKKVSLATLAAVALLLLLLSVSSTYAQRGGRIHYSNLFNPQTVDVVSGEVVRVAHVLAGSGTDYCVQAVLSTSEGQLTAVLAPKGYMEEKGLTIAPQDRVTVSGSRISISNKPFLLVTEMSGDRTMKLREADGRPAWAVGDDWHVR